MNKLIVFFKKLPKYFKSFTKVFHSRSMSTQLIITLILIFASFFLLQTILNSQFFEQYYTQQEFNDISVDLTTYVDNMNDPEKDYYDEMYDFTSRRNAYSVVVSGAFRLLVSSHTDYTIVIEDSTTLEQYAIIVPNNDYNYTLEESLSLTIHQYNDNLYSPTSITTTVNIFSNPTICTIVDCFNIDGRVVEINKPNNLNYLFADNYIVNQELIKLSSGSISLTEFEYSPGRYWYKSEDGSIDTLVFVHELRTWDYIVTVIPAENPTDIINIISSYNYYVYMTAIVIIFLWSFRLSNIISKPIKNIELVAREIAALNFNVNANEFNNKENASLSKSINLISRNLKETLETLNKRNEEVMSLYDEQSKQVSLRKQLVSSISHELKTPLMIMQVTIQGIIDGIVPETDQEKELLNVVEEINKSSLMIQDMLQISRLDDTHSKLEISELNLSDCVRYFIADFDSIIKKYELNLELNIKDNVIIEADNKLINRAISNFFTNAIKYTPENQKIYIEVSETDEKAYFEITNFGTKIKKEDLDKIWIPFFRGQKPFENERLKNRGTGIGLYLVSEILKAHNCEFGLKNTKNGVTAFFYINKKYNELVE